MARVGKEAFTVKKLAYQAILHPEDEGGYSVEVPDIPGCFTCGDSYMDAASMAADAAKTLIASMLLNGEDIPGAKRHNVPDGCESVVVCFEADPSWIVQGEVVSAAQAARELGVSPGRVTHLFDSGQLEGYRQGRRTFITVQSIELRKSTEHAPGRPRSITVTA